MMRNINSGPWTRIHLIRGDAHSKYVNVYFTGYNSTLLLLNYGLPNTKEKDNGNFYGFHIHEGEYCTGDMEDSFKNAGAHYNPDKTEHPKHRGDLPPLLANEGIAWSAVYTDRFYPEEVVGKTVIIHGMADDFKTQPSGNAGMKIACGEIVE